MQRTKLLNIFIAGLALMNIGLLVFILSNGTVTMGPSHDRGPEEGPKQIIIQRLHFDAAQQEKYSILVDEHRSKMHELRDESRMLHNELFSLLESKEIDQSLKYRQIEKIMYNQKALEELDFDHFEKIKALCKGTQVADFNALVNDLGELFAPKGPPPPER